MQIAALLNVDVDHEFRLFRDGDATNRTELWARHFIIAVCSVMLWVATSQLIMLVWGVCYILCNLCYVAFLRKQSFPVPRRRLIWAVLVSSSIAIWYGAMVVYIATLSEGDYLLLSCCGTVGLALHCLARNSEFSYSALVDLGTTILTAVGVLIAGAQTLDLLWTGAVTITGGLCVIAYFGLSFRDIILERQRLNHRRQEETQDEKMRALGQFTSGVAHDFNNLLTVMNGNIELAKFDPDGIESHRYLEEAHAAGMKGAVLIRQLLAFARKSQIVLTDVRLAELFLHLMGLLQRVLPAHVTLSLQNADADVAVRADSAMVESAIINLVINARDALGDTPGRIDISIARASASEVEISVCDTGPGMDAATLERATEPFFTTKDVGEGSGLGLSMVAGVAAQCGGRFVLENRPSGGLNARVLLPTA